MSMTTEKKSIEHRLLHREKYDIAKQPCPQVGFHELPLYCQQLLRFNEARSCFFATL